MRTEIANLSNDWRRDRMRYCVHAPEMLLVVERGEHDAADPEGATADGPVVAVVLAEVRQVRVDGDEAAQDPGLDARQAPGRRPAAGSTTGSRWHRATGPERPRSPGGYLGFTKGMPQYFFHF